MRCHRQWGSPTSSPAPAGGTCSGFYSSDASGPAAASWEHSRPASHCREAFSPSSEPLASLSSWGTAGPASGCSSLTPFESASSLPSAKEKSHFPFAFRVLFRLHNHHMREVISIIIILQVGKQEGVGFANLLKVPQLEKQQNWRLNSGRWLQSQAFKSGLLFGI